MALGDRHKVHNLLIHLEDDWWFDKRWYDNDKYYDYNYYKDEWFEHICSAKVGWSVRSGACRYCNKAIPEHLITLVKIINYGQ